MSPSKKLATEMSGAEARTFKVHETENLEEVGNPIQPSAQQRAMSNSLIVQKILSFMSPMEILKLRPLNRTFEEEATSFLLSNEKARQKFHIKFTWECSADHPHRPDLGHYEHLYMGSLSEFLDDCWKTSRRFPVLNFSFDYCSGWTKDLLDFFANVGKHIHGLSINPSSSSQHQESSLQLLAFVLFGLTPNLKHLTLTSTPWSPTLKILDSINAAEWEDKRRVIPSLETLTLKGQGSNCSFGVVTNILESASNLREVLDPKLKFIEVLRASQKLHLGPKVIAMTFGWKLLREAINLFSKIGEVKPPNVKEISLQFEKNHHPDMWPEIGRALVNIFQASGQCLEKIGKLPLLQCLPIAEPLPVMDKVIDVQFYQPRSSSLKIVPEGQTLQQVFPQLKTLRLSELISSPSNPDTNPLFQPPEVHRHDGVTTLGLTPKKDSSSHPTWIHKAATLFPNLTTLEIEIFDLAATFREIWTHLARLEHLKVSMKFEGHFPSEENLPGEMDSAITGIPLIACNLLRRNLATKGREAGENSDHGNFRQNPSILNLHKLKTFRINVSTPVVKFKPLFTSVSTVYAFEPMFKRQQLKASVGLVENCSCQVEKGAWGVSVAEKEFPICG